MRLTQPRRLVLGAALAMPTLTLAQTAAAPAPAAGARPIPARVLPVPATVSLALQQRIAAPYPPGWSDTPSDADGWRAMQAASAAAVAPLLPGLMAGLNVQRATIAGVPVFDISPQDMPAANRGRVLMHLHGGGYVLFPGLAGAGEAMLMARHGGYRCISVDYRMPPDHPFPAALNDALSVWRALVAERDPRRMGIFGSSAGGGLTLAMLLRARQDDLPMPAAIAPGTPWCDLTGAGDSVQANAFVDNVLVAGTGWIAGAARLYAGGQDLAHPQISPINGDFTDLPPAILTSGTRDILLSDTVRAHRALRSKRIEAALQVFEGQSHAQFLDPGVPETTEAFREIALFLDRHLI